MDDSTRGPSGDEPPTVAVLLVCHNRRDTTLRALAHLTAADPAFQLRVVMFDDGSTDGTAEAVLAQYPQTLLVKGDGNAFWNRGLHAAWSYALKLRVDGFLWLNDDVALDGDALRRLRDGWRKMARHEERFILVGATRGAEGEVTYGGYRVEKSPFALRFKMVPPETDLEPVDTFNGNIVMIPRAVVDAIGLNDAAFHHNFGDNDYGLRARRADIPVRQLEGTLGVCDINQMKLTNAYGSRLLSLRDQWRKVNGHHGLPFASWWRFTRRHSGIWFPLHFLLPYRKLFGIR